jgi:tRNA pseudouridine55 synthase
MRRINHKARNVNGILLLDKPAGITSNAALQHAKRLLNARKAGHTGSLDPLATGLLPICFGEATKFSQFLLDADKSYWTLACLGVRTNTGDADGDVVATQPSQHITEAQITAQLALLQGTIDQIPPMYSALKYQGKPLYKLARAGISVTIKSRKVTIHKLQLLAFSETEIQLMITCSKGTYVRTLVEDLGNALGCGAHVKKLRRLSTGPYIKGKMHTLTTIEDIANQSWQNDTQLKEQLENKAAFKALDGLLLPPDTAVSTLNAVQCNVEQIKDLQQGKFVTLSEIPKVIGIVRVYGSGKIGANAVFIGLAELAENGVMRAKRLMQPNMVTGLMKS